jgi:DNA-binding NarL/FixJ family response regulator
VDRRVNVLLVSEYPLLRLGLATYLQEQAVVDQLHHANSLSVALEKIEHEQIDIALVELALLKPSGLGAIRTLLRPAAAPRLIVLSRREFEPFITQCVAGGALGYLSLNSQPVELLTAIRTVLGGEKYLGRDAAYAYALARLNRDEHVLSTLSSREYQVFTRLARGVSVNDIAATLCLSPKTVHVYRSNILGKLNLATAFELTLLALRSGVITIDSIDE